MIITNQSLDQFTRDLKFRLALFKKFKREADKYLASDFNIFDWIQPDEKQFSDVFAFLLDKEASHAQGVVFLHEFWRFLDLTSLTPEDFRVTQERIIGNGRIDILLESNNQVIIIENKPFALDQEGQIARYVHEYESEDYYVVYLSGDGSDPSEGSITRGQLSKLKEDSKFQTVSYNNLTSWLSSCHQKCQADKLRWLIFDLINYINEHFMEQREESYVE